MFSGCSSCWWKEYIWIEKSKLINHRHQTGNAERERRRKMKPSALAPGMLKGKKHCFLQSLLQSNTGARKGETRGTKEINVVLEKATKAFTKGHKDRCLSAVVALRLYFLWLFAGAAFSSSSHVVSFVAKPLFNAVAAHFYLIKSVQIAGPFHTPLAGKHPQMNNSKIWYIFQCLDV